MLNEGYDLFQSLKRCGIQLTPRHPDIGRPGKQDGLVAGLDPKGRVRRIEFRNAEAMVKLWTTSQGLHNRFPVLKIQRPVYKLSKSDAVRKALNELRNDEARRRQLLLGRKFALNKTSLEENWWKRLHDRARELEPSFRTKSKQYEALHELTVRFLLAENVAAFLEDLATVVKSQQDEITYSLLEGILIGGKWDQNKGEFRAEVPIALDLSDWEKYRVRVASPKFEAFVSECLFRIQADSPGSQYGTSALSGTSQYLVDDKFPNPTLRVIGNTYLFAVNDQTPCQTRYKRTSTATFPSGRTEANGIQDALLWITNSDRREKTWCSIPGNTEDESDLLVAYVAEKPDLDLNKARLLGGVSGSELGESGFAETAASIIKAFRTEHILKASDTIRFFVLRQADPGRKQVVVQRNLTVSEVVSAAVNWQDGAKNVPPLTVLFPGKKGEKAKRLSPRCPFPADIVRVTQRQWLRNGVDYSSRVSGVPLGSVYDVFLDEKRVKNNEARVLLSTILRRTKPLFIGFGGAMHSNDLGNHSTDARFYVLLAVSSIAICLYKLGVKKEDYMKGTYFLVGRFLSLVDVLHFEYCHNVRNKSVPPQLLGNAHLNLALGNPAAAFALLSQRLGVYQAWTRKEQDEKLKLARWAVGEMGRVASMLAEQGLPKTTDDEGKAEILLGYLAQSESKEKPAQANAKNV